MVVAGFFQLNQPVVFILFCSILFYSILLIPLVWDIQTLGVQQWIYMHRFCKNLYETLFPRIWHLCMECSWISLSVWYWNARTKEENNKNDSSSQGFSARISSCFQLLYSNHNSFSWLMFSEVHWCICHLKSYFWTPKSCFTPKFFTMEFTMSFLTKV